MKRYPALFVFVLFLSFNSFGQDPNFGIIPKPNNIVVGGKDSFQISTGTKILFDTKVKNAQLAAQYFISKIAKPTGFKLTFEKVPDPDSKGDINIVFDKTMVDSEAYNLTVDKKQVTIKVRNGAGAFYALQTLLQLMPPTIYGDKKILNAIWKIPSVTINDAPRFKYRGMHLDCGRHLFSADFVKRYIDLLAMHKINTFHWHLTDDQGWRIEIKKYPKLTTVGAFRKETCSENASSTELVCDGMRYGGFYPQTTIKEIVKYAADRFITIIPEIEMPGHAVAALAAYPWLACKDSTYEVRTKFGVSEDVMCPNEKTIGFCQDVLTEVMQLFPSKYIHIGGDEVPKIRWKESAACQAIMKKENLKNEAELQSWFTKQIEKFLNARGRLLIGWDEILEGGLSPNAAVMSWQGFEGGVKAAKQNHDVVMTPGAFCYFDKYQSLSPQEPFAIGGFTTVEKVYSFEPVPEGLSETESKHILGAQGNVWTEYIEQPAHLYYMVLPRTDALCEVLWSDKAARDYKDFLNRLMIQFNRYDVMKLNYAKHVIDVSGTAAKGPSGKPLVSLTTRVEGASIYYTTDGSSVSNTSTKYDAPFELTQACTLKASAFKDNVKLGNEYTQTFFVHKAVGAAITLAEQPSSQYNPGSSYFLVNGVEGSFNYGDGQWFGFSGKNLDAVIDLGSTQSLSKIKVNFNIKNDSWIYAPKSVTFYTSDDGINFTQVFTEQPKMTTRVSKSVALLKEVNARYVKVVAENLGIIPDGQPGAGNPAWLFVDEIEVE